MIQFSCSYCQKAFRVDDRYSGMLVKCPACGRPVQVPTSEPAPPVQTVARAQPPAVPRPKPKPRVAKRLSCAAAEGRRYVVFIGCALLGLHLVGIGYMVYIVSSVTSSVATLTEQLPEFEPTGGDDVSPEVAKARQELQQRIRAIRSQSTSSWLREIASLWMSPWLILLVVLYVFLYLRHDWARLVLGIILVIAGCLGLLGLALGVFSGFGGLRIMSTPWGVFSLLYTLAGLVVNFGCGFTLLNNPSIAAYTSSR